MEETIVSVIEQNYPNVELIIIDGGSSDDSVDMIKKYEQYLTYWISESDHGQAHAINKGLEVATGDLFDWMNSDDRIAPGTFWRIAQAFEKNPEAYVVCGYMTCFSGIKYQNPVRMSIWSQIEKTLIFGSMSVPSMYFRLDKFKEIGKLDERLHYCFDMEFWYRFVEKFGVQRLHFIDESLSFFRLHSDSKTVSQLSMFGEEQYLVQCSVIESFRKKDLPVIPREQLSISANYHRNWDFSGLNPTNFVALAIQRHLESLHERLNLFAILSWCYTSFRLAPLDRNWRFYCLPLRAIRWKLLPRRSVKY